MNRFHQRLRRDLQDPEFAEAFYDMSVDIALRQVLEQARKAVHTSEKDGEVRYKADIKPLARRCPFERY